MATTNSYYQHKSFLSGIDKHFQTRLFRTGCGTDQYLTFHRSFLFCLISVNEGKVTLSLLSSWLFTLLKRSTCHIVHLCFHVSEGYDRIKEGSRTPIVNCSRMKQKISTENSGLDEP